MRAIDIAPALRKHAEHGRLSPDVQRIRQLGLTLPVVGVTANALAEENNVASESGMGQLFVEACAGCVRNRRWRCMPSGYAKRGHKNAGWRVARPACKDESTGRPDKRSAIVAG